MKYNPIGAIMSMTCFKFKFKYFFALKDKEIINNNPKKKGTENIALNTEKLKESKLKEKQYKYRKIFGTELRVICISFNYIYKKCFNLIDL